MSAPVNLKHDLRLELLEARTLLAGIEGDLSSVTPAVTGSGSYTVELSPIFWNKQLVLVGTPTSSIEIDFNQLPAFVTSINISSFDNVVFKGQDTLEKLIATDINSLSAPQITLTTGLSSSNVDAITLASVGDLVLLKGDETRLETTFSKSTNVISDLKSLEIASTSTAIFVTSLNETQLIKLDQPTEISVIGLANVEKQVGLKSQFIDSPGTGDPDNGGGGVVVIDVPTDERTEALLAHLRDLLRSGSGDNQQLAFEMVVGNNLFESLSNRVLGLPTAATLDPLSLALSRNGHADRLIIEQTPVSSLDTLTDKPHFQTLGDVELARIRAASPVEQAITSDDLPLTAVPPAYVVELADVDGFDVDGATDAGQGRIVLDEVYGVFLASLEERPKDLTYHLLDRVAAELSPARQTAFLLVDPKPSRSSLERSRESTLEALSMALNVPVV